MKLPRTTGNERVIDQLRARLAAGATVHCASPGISLHACAEVREMLAKPAAVRLLLQEGTTQGQSLFGGGADISYRGTLRGRWLAKTAHDWITSRAEVRQAAGPPSQSIILVDGSGTLRAVLRACAFTTEGLGIAPGGQLGLVRDTDTDEEAVAFADSFQSNCEPLKPQAGREHLAALVAEMASQPAPRRIYFKFLFELVKESGDEVDEEFIAKSAACICTTTVWRKLLEFQRDGVVGAIDKLKRIGGCVIAGSVGLGKTFEALAAVKYYALGNNRISVLWPKRLRVNWTLYKTNGHRNSLAGHRFNYDLLDHTDLSRVDPGSGDIDLSRVNCGNYDPVMIDESHNFRNKATHRDHGTLSYLQLRIGTLLGPDQAVVTVRGGTGRRKRTRAQEAFQHDPDVQVLLTTDAAGEGINLQRAYLMVNCGLPGNPNRLEQRFGRILRIRQTELCHLWKLVAEETREGDVYRQLLEKLAQVRPALDGQVFDALGEVQFAGRSLLIDAIRYRDQTKVRPQTTKAVDNAVDKDPLRVLPNDQTLAPHSMDASRVHHNLEDKERAEARCVQPHYSESLLLEAFKRLGGAFRQHERRRCDITHIPTQVRNHDRLIDFGESVMASHERIAIVGALVAPQRQALAAFVWRDHPLLNVVIHISLHRYRDLLQRGTVLVDERDPDLSLCVLFFLEHAIQDASVTKSGDRCVVTKRLPVVEIDAQGTARHLKHAPYLDYRPLAGGEPAVETFLAQFGASWVRRDPEKKAQADAIADVVQEHLAEVRDRKRALLDKTEAALEDRLTKEIIYWEFRAEHLREQERAGKVSARLNFGEARKRADELQARLQRRMGEIQRERQLSPRPPVVLDGLLVVFIGLIRAIGGQPHASAQTVVDSQATAARARDIVMGGERGLGFIPTDREFGTLGYDIESAIPGTGRPPFIEVNGRVAGADTVIVTKNEVLDSVDKPDECILALLASGTAGSHEVRYPLTPFDQEPDFGATSANYVFSGLLKRAEMPR